MALRDLTLGVIQLAASRSKEEALARLEEFSRRVREADILVMPEYAMMDPTDAPLEALRASAESLQDPGPWLRALEGLAEEHSSCVVATYFEPAPDGRVYNSAVVISDRGEHIAWYRKTHLFDAYGYRESEKIAPGDRVFEPVEACGARIGLIICFELRVCELARLQALRGAEVLVVPAAWYSGPMKEEALHVLARARAHENTVFVAVAALAGGRFTGRSIIVDPSGVPLMDAGPKPSYVEVRLESWRLEEARRSLPILSLLRRDLIGIPGGAPTPRY